ncbi:MAG TPA: S41 family peptidase [Rhizomicrobium sp.]|nr:S41 family peptidase [Rhizomicrobium sp.]
MNRRELLAVLMASALPFPADAAGSDIAWLIDEMVAKYAYLRDRHIDLARLRQIYVAEEQAATDARAFLGVLEHFLAEFHDHHIEANTNNNRSPQLVPTGTDLWAVMRDGRAFIDQVRPDSPSSHAGVRIGDEVLTIGGVPVKAAIAAHAPRCLVTRDPEADDYTLRVLLAGTHDAHRAFTLRDRKIDLPPYVAPKSDALVTHRMIDGIGVIRIENSLGEDGLVAAFDKTLADLSQARALILDLRDTQSGGNTEVAEPIMGRFITGRPGYQRVFDPGPGKTFPEDSWVRWVRERGPTVQQKLAVLVNRWTGSMGEGMAIGFDGMKRGTVVGTRMAGLCGATDGITLPNSGIGVHFPTERLYHLDNTPREKWKPPVLVDLATAKGDDPILTRALEVLKA